LMNENRHPRGMTGIRWRAFPLSANWGEYTTTAARIAPAGQHSKNGAVRVRPTQGSFITPVGLRLANHHGSAGRADWSGSRSWDSRPRSPRPASPHMTAAGTVRATGVRCRVLTREPSAGELGYEVKPCPRSRRHGLLGRLLGAHGASGAALYGDRKVALQVSGWRRENSHRYRQPTAPRSPAMGRCAARYRGARRGAPSSAVARPCGRPPRIPQAAARRELVAARWAVPRCGGRQIALRAAPPADGKVPCPLRATGAPSFGIPVTRSP